MSHAASLGQERRYHEGRVEGKKRGSSSHEFLKWKR
jgi:hypothetical protein